jgi:hypothetical protein
MIPATACSRSESASRASDCWLALIPFWRSARASRSYMAGEKRLAGLRCNPQRPAEREVCGDRALSVPSPLRLSLLQNQPIGSRIDLLLVEDHHVVHLLTFRVHPRIRDRPHLAIAGHDGFRRLKADTAFRRLRVHESLLAKILSREKWIDPHAFQG